MSKKLTNDEFIERCKKVHGGKYDYSKVEYNGLDKVIHIICPKHGEFEQTASNHLSGKGCKKCKADSISLKLSSNTADFIDKAKKKYDDFYDYSKVEYTRSRFNVKVICPIHGEFLVTPNNHLRGRGCPKCRYKKVAEKLSKTTEEFIEKAKKIHGNKYDYSKVEYKNWVTSVQITCPIHGEFSQTPYAHERGQGCPFCASSHLEEEIRTNLLKENIEFEYEKKYDWLLDKRKLPLDFYLPQHNIGIECQGVQHFEIVKHFGGDKKHEERIRRDKLKKQLCDEHGIELIYFTHEKVEEPYLGKVFTDINDLLEYIRIKENNDG